MLGRMSLLLRLSSSVWILLNISIRLNLALYNATEWVLGHDADLMLTT
jgi:hypothetical protein